MRYEVSNAPAKLTITVHARWNWWAIPVEAIFFYLAWRWSASLTSRSTVLLLGIFLLLGQSIWAIAGRERLLFGDDSLTVEKNAFFFSHTKSFPLSTLSEPFFVPAEDAGENSTPSGIGIDFGGIHLRFLDGLEESDVSHIVSLIRGTYPELAKRWNRPNPQFSSDGIVTLGLSRRD